MVATAPVATCPISPLTPLNQRLLSGPAVISRGMLLAVGIENSAIFPAGVIRPILSSHVLGEPQVPVRQP